MRLLRRVVELLLSILFPRLCLVCGKALVEGEQHMCLLCLDIMPRTRYHLERDNALEQIFWGKVDIYRVTSLFHFYKGGGYRDLIHNIKYRDGKSCARYMGYIAAKEVAESGFLEGIDAVVPVPLHARRKAIRGFNQSEEIALGISKHSGIPVWSDILVRTKHNPTQTMMKREERWDNVNSIFSLINKERIAGKHILLVDDVITSGSTLEACARELHRADGIRVSILTLASV
ncbi:MAG: ComF family protein [Bacteroidales bacterium]